MVRAYVDAPDALQRTRLLALLRETAAAATAKALPADEVSNVETTAENKDAAAEWSAGVALAAMLRAASPENRPALETDKAAAPKDAVDASAATPGSGRRLLWREGRGRGGGGRRGDGGGRGDAQGRDGARYGRARLQEKRTRPRSP